MSIDTGVALASTAVPAIALATAVSLHVATWGAFKDSPFEGYHPARQARTFVIALFASVATVAVANANGLGGVGALLPMIGVVYALERLATEWWKAIVRSDDQSRYTIPMRLGFRGRPVNRPGARWAVGLSVVLGLFGAGLGVQLMQASFGGAVPSVLATVTIGGVGGWLTAVGGAWKDAPVEGFSGWKFLRSPSVATAWAIPLSMLTDSWVMLVLAAAGMAVASIETYKTFLTDGRAPGKFDGKPRQWVAPRSLRSLGRVHAAGWGAFAAASLLQLLSAATTQQLTATVAAGAAVAFCGVAALTVLRSTEQLTAKTGESAGGPEPTDELVTIAA